MYTAYLCSVSLKLHNLLQYKHYYMNNICSSVNIECTLFSVEDVYITYTCSWLCRVNSSNDIVGWYELIPRYVAHKT